MNAQQLAAADPHRQVALMLHGLAEQDRAWILEQLGGNHEHSLRPLLNELQELGISADPALTAQALLPHVQVCASPVGEDIRLTTIARASAQELVRALEREPPGIVAALLAAGDWPWHEAYLGSLEPSRARTLRELSARWSSGPALRDAILDAVSERLIATSRVAAPFELTQHPDRPWTRLVGLLRGWRVRASGRDLA